MFLEKRPGPPGGAGGSAEGGLSARRENGGENRGHPLCL